MKLFSVGEIGLYQEKIIIGRGKKPKLSYNVVCDFFGMCGKGRREWV